jgi:hypothetical protein
MSNKEVEQQIQSLKELRKQVRASKEVARALLLKTGIYTKAGALKRAYR